MIAGDRGLCGGYNAQAIKKAEQRIAELKAQNIKVELLTIGNKAGKYFSKRPTPIRKSIPCTQAPTAKQAQEVANELLSSYYAGELDRIELLYTKFISMVASTPAVPALAKLVSATYAWPLMTVTPAAVVPSIAELVMRTRPSL